MEMVLWSLKASGLYRECRYNHSNDAAVVVDYCVDDQHPAFLHQRNTSLKIDSAPERDKQLEQVYKTPSAPYPSVLFTSRQQISSI